MGEGQRHVLGPRRLVGPLDQRVRHPRRVAVGQVGLQGDLRPRLLAGGDQQRRVVGLGVEDRPHRVADARRGMEVDDGGLAGGLGEAVGHPDHDRLLQTEHVAEVRRVVGEHRQLGRAGVAEHRRHPVGAEEVERRVADRRHRWNPIPSPPTPGRKDPCRERMRQESGSRSRWGPVDNAGVRNRSLKLPLGIERIGLAVALACAALLCLAASASAGPDRDPPRLRPRQDRADPGLDPARSRRHGRPADPPGPALDRQALPDLRHRRLLRTAAQRRARRLRRMPHAAAPITTTASPSTWCRWARGRNATPPGRRSPASPSGPSRSRARPALPFRWVGYDGDAGHGCGHHLHLSWNHAAGAPVPARRMGRSLPGRPARPRSVETAPDQALRPPRSRRPAPPAASPRSAPAASAPRFHD